MSELSTQSLETLPSLTWKKNNPCSGIVPEAQQLFWVGQGEGRIGKAARAAEVQRLYCNYCDNVEECIREGVEIGDQYTIRGGMLPEDRPKAPKLCEWCDLPLSGPRSKSRAKYHEHCRSEAQGPKSRQPPPIRKCFACRTEITFGAQRCTVCNGFPSTVPD